MYEKNLCKVKKEMHLRIIRDSFMEEVTFAQALTSKENFSKQKGGPSALLDSPNSCLALHTEPCSVQAISSVVSFHSGPTPNQPCHLEQEKAPCSSMSLSGKER